MRSYEHRFLIENPDDVEVIRGFGSREVNLRIEDVTLIFTSFDSFKTFTTIFNERARRYEEKQLERISHAK